ncbi:MAG: O-antigen ligase family protein [Kiritimatiellae bacterium]|nr:O-antigen ligase family protein [Kiritimatiellia bacterium]
MIALLGAASFLGIGYFGGVGMEFGGLLMAAVFAGSALCFTRPLLAAELRRLQVPPGGWAALCMAVFGLAMIPFSKVPYESRIEFLKLASYVAAYWAWTEIAAWHKRWRYLLGALIFVAALITWYAIIQHGQGARMVLYMERPETYGMRASGTYICPNHFAHLLEMVLCMGLALALMPAAGAVLRVVAWYGVLLFLPVLFLTQSRSGWLGAAVGVTTTLALMAWRRSRKLFGTVLVALPLAVAVLAVAAWFLSPMVRERVAGAMLSAPDGAVSARLQMWKDTVAMVRDAPLFGHGPGVYRWLYDHYKSHNLPFWFTHAHNEYLHAAAEYGLAGVLLFAIVLAGAAGRLLLLVRRVGREKDAFLIAGFLGAVAASLVHAVFDFNLHIFANTHVLVLLGGVVAAGLYASGDLKAREIRAPAAYIVWGGPAAVALVLALSAVRTTAGYDLKELAERQEARIELDRALTWYRRAAAVDPGYWEAHLGAAEVLTTLGFWNLDEEAGREQARQALAAYERAQARNPLDMDNLLGKAKAYSILGEQEKALATLRLAVDFAPNERVYREELEKELLSAGRPQEAARVYEKPAGQGPSGHGTPLHLDILRGKAPEAGERAE